MRIDAGMKSKVRNTIYCIDFFFSIVKKKHYLYFWNNFLFTAFFHICQNFLHSPSIWCTYLFLVYSPMHIVVVGFSTKKQTFLVGYFLRSAHQKKEIKAMSLVSFVNLFQDERRSNKCEETTIDLAMWKLGAGGEIWGWVQHAGQAIQGLDVNLKNYLMLADIIYATSDHRHFNYELSKENKSEITWQIQSKCTSVVTIKTVVQHMYNTWCTVKWTRK